MTARADTAAHDTAAHVRGYLAVFGTLLVLTLVTVGASYLDLATGPTIALGLVIATVKAGLVAAFFMHLRHERALIYAAMGLTAVTVVSLFALTLWTEAAHAPGTQFAAPFTVTAPPAAAPSEGAH
jgi:cytochrome c oxidase subunit 4